MSKDIVERLRAYAPISPTMRDAADEIERLRAENKRIVEALDDPELSAVARILRARLGGPPVVTLTEGEPWPERKA